MFFFFPPMGDFKTLQNVMNKRKVLNYNNGRPTCKRRKLKCFCGEFTGGGEIYIAYKHEGRIMCYSENAENALFYRRVYSLYKLYNLYRLC